MYDAERMSGILTKEYARAKKNPGEIFGIATYGNITQWPILNKQTGGIQPKAYIVLAARPKVGKSQFLAGLVPGIAEQADKVNKKVLLVTLETSRIAYHRRMAATMASIPHPNRIRQGALSGEEEDRYIAAVEYLATLPIVYLSNEDKATREEQVMFDNTSTAVTFSRIDNAVTNDVFWWAVDHIGLVADAPNSRVSGTYDKIYRLANEFARLSQRVGGLVVTHLNRSFVTGQTPDLNTIAGADQLGRNASVLMFLDRPFSNPAITDEDRALVRDNGWEPAVLYWLSRNEGSGVVFLQWVSSEATFRELDTDHLILPGGQKRYVV